jgi:hypothetical protein
LVSSFGYNAAGWVESVTDPRAIVTKTFYDNLQRKVKIIQAEEKWGRTTWFADGFSVMIPAWRGRRAGE